MASAPKQPGFLTKMVGLIRASGKEPAPHDGDSVHSRHAADQAMEREAIREHIERRRRDDQIRRREFNYLRKVRAEGLTAFPGEPVRPSGFQSSSMFNPDASQRSRTVGKIDAIEAQMLSPQWTAGRATVRPPPVLQPTPVIGTRSMLLQPVVAVAPPPTPAPHEAAPEAIEFEIDLDFTGLIADQGSATQLTPIAASSAPAAAPGRDETERPAAASGVVDQFRVEHPALHRAASCFAAGDDEAAEAALLAILQSPDAGDAAAEACSAGLLDLYRATGQQADFDTVAIEYAQLFGRSAPEWFAVHAVAPTHTGTPNDATLLGTGAPATMGWACPAHLTLRDTATLRQAAGPLHVPPVQWDALQTIAPECVGPLRVLFQEWADSALELRFSGTEALLHALAQTTPLEDRQVDPAWWHLRLEVLRTLGHANDFEEVALNFCVTYEVSPPSWTPPRCRLVGALPVATVPSASAWAPLETEAQPESGLALQGVLEGDVTLALAQLLQRAPPEDPLMVSCARLVRVDLTAAASLLTWVTEVTASGRRSVQFVHVPRLVAAYFEVVGISAQARVLTGK